MQIAYRKPHRRFDCISARLSHSILFGALLTACPLTDRYYIDQQQSSSGGLSVGGASDQGVGGRTVTGGTSNSGGNTAQGGVTAATTSDASGGAPNTSCDAATCNGVCCNNHCVDLQTDAANCGGCTVACPSGSLCRAGVCYGWTSMAAAPLALGARERSAYAVMGSQLFIFGGLDAQGNALNSGAIYDKPTDSWKMLPQSASVPSPRQQATAIGTVGGRVFVLGGSDAASTLAYGDDARYDSSTNSWVALQPLLTGCVSPWALSTVNYLMLWGGLSAGNAPLLGGQRYTYNSGGVAGPSWTIVNTSSATPERVSEASFATASDSAFAFGGKVNGTTKTNHGFIYSFATNAWAAIGMGPSARWGAFAVSDGTAYFLWGGRDETTVMNSGYVQSNGWTTLGSAGVASARWAPYRRTGWAFAFAAGDIAIVGGMDLAGRVLMDGARYIRATDSWTPILPWPSQEAHEYGVAAVIDGEIFLWGGRDGTTVTATGERYKP